MEWALSPKGWHLNNDNKTYNLGDLELTEEFKSLYKDKTFFKERWIKKMI